MFAPKYKLHGVANQTIEVSTYTQSKTLSSEQLNNIRHSLN